VKTVNLIEGKERVGSLRGAEGGVLGLEEKMGEKLGETGGF
jgi:hypothetical protein